MEAINTAALVDNLWRAAALGFVVGLILWVFRRMHVVKRIRLSAIFAVIGWSTLWVVSSLEMEGLEGLLKLLLSAAILLSANIGVQMLDVIVWSSLNRRDGRRVIPRLLMEIFNIGLMIAATLLVLDEIYNVDLNALLVTSTVISAVIGLALQDMLGNIVAGLALQFDGSLEAGDWIRVDDFEGRVTEMNWRTVTINTLENHAITVPNTNIAKNGVVNFSKPTTSQRLQVTVGLPYSVAPGRIKHVLLPAVLGANGVSETPSPDIITKEYGDSAIIYNVRFWITDYSRHQHVKDEVLSRIWYALYRAGISVPFPIRDVNLRSITEEVLAKERQSRLDTVINVLRQVEIFEPLSNEQITSLAGASDFRMYYEGETLMRQDDVGDTLFVVESGEARIEFVNTKGALKQLGRGSGGDVFGEMSLLTGERRRASVVAETEIRVVVVGKSALANALRDDLSSLEALTSIMQKRLEALAELADADITLAGRVEPASLFASISKFLGVGQK